MAGYMAVSAVGEKDVSRRKGEGKKEKRRMSLLHVGWPKKQWRSCPLHYPVQLLWHPAHGP
jgi:hypothetical protein